MLEQLKLAAFVLLLGLVVVLLLAVMSDYASGGDYVVTRGTAIQSERPIGLLIAEAGLGVLNGRSRIGSTVGADNGGTASLLGGAEIVGTALRIDGRPAPGIGGMARAAWRLIGFLLWDASGRIERVTSLKFRGRNVGIVDRIENGRVWIQVVVGPPLGDPRVRFAVLTLEANEHVRVQNESTLRSWPGANSTLVLLFCSAVIDLPCDGRRDRVHARRVRWGCDRPTWSEGKGETKAGTELAGRVDDLERTGRLAVADGHRQIRAVIAEFLERTCR